MSRSDARTLGWGALLALGSCLLTLLTGLLASLAHSPEAPALRASGLMLERLRPLHDSSAIAWMFLGGAAAVQFFLRLQGDPFTSWERRRAFAHNLLWAAAGLGIIATLMAGRFTGREYLGYSPILSIPIALGWVLFAWNYYGRVGFRLKGRPVYVYMWSVAVPLLLITYAESHLHLLVDAVGNRPLRDIAVQWKANGALVGAFNHLCYGALMWASARLHGSEDYARSRTAFALFLVGLLNTFTNYGHHTYHLPQTPVIHWIAFGVSMLEVIILAKVGLDLLGLVRGRGPAVGSPTARTLLRSTTGWIFGMLLLALLISVPPLNTLIHGTYVVIAHSMGSMIGINTTILLAALAILVPEITGRPLAAPWPRAPVIAFNASLAAFWAILLARGAAAGWMRQRGPSAPDLTVVTAMFPAIFMSAGSLVAMSLLVLILPWIADLAAIFRRRPAPDPAGARDPR